MFFVGVQLDITAPPTPKANANSQSPLHPTPVQAPRAAAAGQQSDDVQQPPAPPSPAAAQEAQAQQPLPHGQTAAAVEVDSQLNHQEIPQSQQHPAQAPSPQAAEPGVGPAQSSGEQSGQVPASQIAETAASLPGSPRQLLTRQSAPAGSPLAAAAARAALLPDSYDHALHVQTKAARQRALLAEVPECGEVSCCFIAAATHCTDLSKTSESGQTDKLPAFAIRGASCLHSCMLSHMPQTYSCVSAPGAQHNNSILHLMHRKMCGFAGDHAAQDRSQRRGGSCQSGMQELVLTGAAAYFRGPG